ncbi:MAG: extracellular solute-binding protein [bacterium]
MIFWVLPNYGVKTIPVLRQLLEEFSREHPGIKVEVEVKNRRTLWQQLFLCLRRHPSQSSVSDRTRNRDLWSSEGDGYGPLTAPAPSDDARGRKRDGVEARGTQGSGPPEAEQLRQHPSQSYGYGGPPEAEQLRQPGNFRAPDLIQIPHHWTTVFSRLGLFQDLAEADWRLQGELPEILARHCVLAGTDTFYSAPWWMEITALHSRTETLRCLNAGSESGFSSWESFIAACEELRNRFGTSAADAVVSGRRLNHKRPGTGRPGRVHATGRPGDGFYPVINKAERNYITAGDVMPCVWNRGGDIFTADGGRSMIHKDEAVRGITDYLRLAEDGLMPVMEERGPVPVSLDDRTAAMAFCRRLPSLWKAGAAARLRRDSSAGGAVRVLPFPGGGRSLICGHNLAMLRDCRCRREAGILLKWLTASEAQSRHARLIHAFPCRLSSLEELMDADRENGRIYRQILSSGRVLPNVTVTPTCERLLDSALWKTSLEIAGHASSGNSLARKLITVQAEVDYLLSLYGDR